jgi:hypothetical protein
MAKMTRVIYRSAVTGKTVTAAYAKSHPSTTVKEHRPIGTRKTKR